jgi:hypothetical protein
MSQISNPPASGGGADGQGVRQAFRGLHLRTHPDADKAASQVMLGHADEIVLSDGSRITPSDNLVADITVSGIGGLRTGQAEAASTWYKVLIGQGGSGIGLWLERAKDYLLDQSFTTAVNSGFPLLYLTGTPSDRLAQGVTFATAGVVPFVDVWLQRTNSPSGKVWVTIEADAAGSPSGTPLATSDKIDAALISTTGHAIRFVFRAPATVTAAAHHIVLYGDYARSTTVTINWRGTTAGGYAGGVAKMYNGATWSAVGDPADLYFRAYVTRNDNAIAPPTGYGDGYAQIGWAYNNSSSNLVEFIARDRAVLFRAEQQVISAATATVPTLVDLASVVPPVSVLIDKWRFAQSAAGAQLNLASAMGTARDFGALWMGGANHFADLGTPFPIEAQHLYYSVDTGSGYAYVRGFGW